MKIYLSSKADKQLGKIPRGMHQLLVNKIESLGINPFPQGVKKLTNREGWRVRVGDYRILYTLERKNETLVILSVAHRKEAYR